MTLEEIKKLWPAWRIEFVCDYACKQLRDRLSIKYIFLESSEWQYGFEPKDEEYQIKLRFENQVDGSYSDFEFMDVLFIKDSLEFDKKTGANKMSNIRDKVILRIAGHLKERWRGR